MAKVEYKTREGDTFDIIALMFLNDEFQASRIMQENPDHIGSIVFPAGVTIIIPQIDQEAASSLPPWRR